MRQQAGHAKAYILRLDTFSALGIEMAVEHSGSIRFGSPRVIRSPRHVHQSRSRVGHVVLELDTPARILHSVLPREEINTAIATDLIHQN